MNNIEQTIRRMSDEELVQIVNKDFEEYTDEALFYARSELRARNVSESQDEPDPAAASDGFAEPKAGESLEHARKMKEIMGLLNNREKLIEAFLADELQYLESCNAILDFVKSMNIRNGEYEGSSTVIKKMDLDNFILYAEGTNDVGGKLIPACVAVGKEELEEKIREIAKRNNIMLEEEIEEDGGQADDEEALADHLKLF